jgi:hypothetical protein
MPPPCTPPPRRILIIRQSPPITPRYNARGVRSYRRCLLSKQQLLRHLIGLLGCDFLVSFTIENYPTQRQFRFLGDLIEQRIIINGDLHSVVSSGRNHLYVGDLTLISQPLPSYQAVVAAVWAALMDRTPLHYY